jgi:hypothetical protein
VSPNFILPPGADRPQPQSHEGPTQGLAAGEALERSGNLLAGDDASDHRPDLLLQYHVVDLLHQAPPGGVRNEVPPEAPRHRLRRGFGGVGQHHPADLEVARREAPRDEELLVDDALVGCEAHHEVAAIVRNALHGVRHHGQPDGVEDDVYASAVGFVEDDLREARLAVVDRDVRTQLAAQLELRLGARRREDPCADVLGRLDRSGAGASRGRMDQNALAALEVCAIEEAEPGQMEREVERRRIRQRDLGGHLEGGFAGAHGVLREAAERAGRKCDDALSLPARGPVSTRLDDPHHLHPRNRRQGRAHHHVLPVDALHVVQVERNRLDPDEQLPGRRLGDRDSVDLEHPAGLPVFVDAPCTHGLRSGHRELLAGPWSRRLLRAFAAGPRPVPDASMHAR